MDKYNKSVRLLCPLCRNALFEEKGDSEREGVTEQEPVYKCIVCGRIITKDELLAANQETIDCVAEDLANEVIRDIVKRINKDSKL